MAPLARSDMTPTDTRPRRIRGEGSFSQRADGTWVGTVDLGWAGGKRVRKSVSAKTKKAAQAKFIRLKRDVEKGVGLESSSTVEAWLTHWLDTIATERNRARTIQGYRGYIKTWLIPHLGTHRLDKLTEDHVRALYRAMKDQGKSDATRRQAHSILRRALKVAMQEGRVPRNVAANVDAPPVGVVHRTPLTLEQARQVLASLDGDPLAARWVAALLLGMRQGECLGLKWEDVDLEAGTIRVRRELLRITGQGLVETPPKSERSKRPIPIIGPMAYALSQTERRGEYVFYGKRQDPRQDWQAWKGLLVRAGVPDSPLAAARTTTSTLLRDAGVPDTVTRDIFGHSQVQVTQGSYMRTDLPTMRAAMLALEVSVQPAKVKPVRKRA
jgi:integrase